MPSRKDKRSPQAGRRRPRKNGRTVDAASDEVAWNLRLYVAGRSPKSEIALSNLRRLCEDHIPGRYSIEIVDLLTNPQLAKADQILAIPTLVRKLPTPVKRIIGDLSNSERAIIALDLRQLPQ